ncbi:MAG: tuaG [Chitinophagaceae bacterium]|nr:tuaG [Chitinophagaceae bacterium]
MILFSIVIPTYNRAAFIGKAIDSVLAQTYAHWELIIIDDASSDPTQDIVGKYLDPRIKYYRNETNMERSASRNRGITLSTGDYICFLDSDDYYYGHHLETLYQKIQALSQPVALIHTSAVVVNAKDVVLKELKYFYTDFKEKIEAVLNEHILIHTVGIHRNILQQFKFDTQLAVNEDVYLFAQIAAAYPVVHIAECTVAWVHHGDNTTHQVNDHLTVQLKATQKIFANPLIAPLVSAAFKKKKYFDLYSQLVYFYASNRKHTKSVLYFLRGIQVAPFHKQNKNNLLNVIYHLPGGNGIKKIVRWFK